MLYFLFFYSTYALNYSISGQQTYTYVSTVYATPSASFAPTSTVVPTETFVPTSSFVPTASFVQITSSPTSLSYSFFYNTQSATLSSSNYVNRYTPSVSTIISNPIIPAASINQNYNIYYSVFTLFGCGIILIGIIFFCLKQNQVEHKNRNLLYNIHTLNNPVVNNPVPYFAPKSVFRDGKIFYYDGDTGKLLAEGWQRYSDNVDVWYSNSITNESSWIPVYLTNDSS